MYNKKNVLMKKLHLICIFVATSFCAAWAQTNVYFHLKGGSVQQWPLEAVDSISYVAPATSVLLPAELTLGVGDSLALGSILDGNGNSSIQWRSSDVRIAKLSGANLLGVKQGKCFLYATSGDVTAQMLVRITATSAQLLEDVFPVVPRQAFSAAEIGAYMAQTLTSGDSLETSTGFPYRYGWGGFLEMSKQPLWIQHCQYIAPMYEDVITRDNEGSNVKLLATTIYLHSLMLVIDMYGVAPLYGSYDLVQPVFYSQEKVYNYIDSLFTETNKHYVDPAWLTDAKNVTITDPFYGADLAKWGMLTKALQARFMIRKLPNWENNAETCNKIISLANEVLESSNWQEPRYQYVGGSAALSSPWGPQTKLVNALECVGNYLDRMVPATFFLHATLGSIDGGFVANRGYSLDPRAQQMLTPIANTAMLHHESNRGITTGVKTTDYPSFYSANNPYTQDAGYVALITQEELMFIKAEAEYWAGNKANAYSATVEATKYNMNRYGLNYESIMSGVEGTNKKNWYNRFLELKLPSADAFTIADLMQQKYVAMCLQPEQWVDMRRYNYSSDTNGILYDNTYVYTVKNVHNGKRSAFKQDGANYTETYSLRMPYHLDSITINQLNNNWINRITIEQTTQKQYFEEELKRLNIEQNVQWLGTKMIWQ